jgi:hypothetical protein
MKAYDMLTLGVGSHHVLHFASSYFPRRQNLAAFIKHNKLTYSSVLEFGKKN